MSTFVQATLDTVSSIVNSGQPVSFADFRRLVGEGARPLECSPDVTSSGFFQGYKMDNMLAELAASDSSVYSSCGVETMLATRSDLVTWAVGQLATHERVGLGVPTPALLQEANHWAAKFLGAAAATGALQAQILDRNLAFLREFTVDSTHPSEWSPELVYAAAIKLVPEQFWTQSCSLPLALLVLPLWIKATGQVGNQLPCSEEAYVDLIVRQWLLRCTHRSTSNIPDTILEAEFGEIQPVNTPAKRGEKFNYIVQEGTNSFRVMSQDDAVIDGNLQGAALLARTVAVLNEVGGRCSIPRRPRNRLRAAAKRLQAMHLSEAYRSVAAQIVLRHCEDRLVPDPRIFSASENPLKVMKLIWYISRRNIPTIITLPRNLMCALNSSSLWFDILGDALVPAEAFLGFPGPIFSRLNQALGGGEMSTLDDATTARLSVNMLEAAMADPVVQSEVQAVCLRVLDCTSIDDAILAVDTIYGEAKFFALKINGAIECLRETRLMREDILAHTSNAWGSAMGCVTSCACLYAALGRIDLAKPLVDSQRMIANHFAPDIYPWAHAISLCNGYLGGYAICSDEKKDPTSVKFTATSCTETISFWKTTYKVTATARVPVGTFVVPNDIYIPNLLGFIDYESKMTNSVIDGDETVLHFQLHIDRARGAQSIEPGQTWDGTVKKSTMEISRINYENSYEQVVSNLNDTLKQYVMRIVSCCSAAVPVEVREAKSFSSFLAAWDRTAPGASEPFYTECCVSEDDIAIAMDGNSRPPCSGFLDIDAPDGLAAAVARFNRSDITRIMCLMSSGGRRVLSRSMITARPSAVSMVWAVLRGVNDHDWVQRFSSS